MTIRNFNNIQAHQDLEVGKNTKLKGKLDVLGLTELSDALITGATTLNNTLDVSGATTLTGATTLNNTLDVSGATTLTGALTVSGLTTLNDMLSENITAKHLYLSEGISAGGQLNAKALVINGATGDTSVEINGDTTLTGALDVSGATTLRDTLTVSDYTILQHTLTVSGYTALQDALVVSGATTLRDTLTVSGDTTFTGEKNSFRKITVTEFANINKINCDTIIETTKLQVGAATSIDNEGIATNSVLTTDFASENASINNLIVTNGLGVSGATTLASSLSVSGATTLDSSLSVSGATTLNDLSVAGTVNIGEQISIDESVMKVGVNFTIDPSGHGINAPEIGTLTILGNLQVQGTYNTINSIVTKNDLEIIDKTITIGQNSTDAVSGDAVEGTGIFFGKNTVNDKSLGSFLYKYDGDAAADHSKHFVSNLPVRMEGSDWRATEDNELITKAQMDQNLTKGGNIQFEALAGIQLKIVSNQLVVNEWVYDTINFSPFRNSMLYILNNSEETLDLKLNGNIITEGEYALTVSDKLGDGSYAPRVPGDRVLIYTGMNFYVYDVSSGWHQQI